MPRFTHLRFLIFAAMMTGLSAVAVPTSAQVINEDFKILADDGAERDFFGYSIAIDNGIVAVAAIWDDDNGPESGSAYLFHASNGAPILKLIPNDGVEGDFFGHSIAIDNSIVAIGARGDDDLGNRSGSAYLFDASTGAQLFKLLPRDGEEMDEFGTSIAIKNGVVAVGAPNHNDDGVRSGVAYLFDAATGIQLAKLLPRDGARDDEFGYSIAIDNGIVAVGAKLDDPRGDVSGSAYLFDAITREQFAKLVPDDGAAGDFFGSSIAIDNGIVAVGAHGNEDNGVWSGSAYLFDALSGKQITKILPEDGAEFTFFGHAIDIHAGVVAVGADQLGFGGRGPGMAYLFDVSTGAQIAKLLASDRAMDDAFGFAIALEDGIVAAGAHRDDDNDYDSGSAYIIDVNSILSCLHLTVENLSAGEEAIITITGGTPGAKAVTVYGTKPGHTFVYRYAGYCATFGIKGVHQAKVLGGFDQIFDTNGEITFTQFIPDGAAEMQLFFQSAERGTCPDRCMSNRMEATVQ